MKLYVESDFLKAISRSYINYKTYGARSTRKLEPIHKYITDVLKLIWGSDYSISSLELNNKEMVVDGKYYPKRIDITVTKNENPIFCLGIKFITGNYKQNSNNYFESMMGETANIQALPNIKYAHLIILRRYTPYYTKNEPLNPSKIEKITQYDLIKYLKLMYDKPYPHQPYLLCIYPIDIDDKTNEVVFVNYELLFENNENMEEKAEKLDLFHDCFSPENFFMRISKFKAFFELSQKQ